MKQEASMKVRHLLLTTILTLTAVLAQSVSAQDDSGVPPSSQHLERVEILNSTELEFTKPGQTLDLRFRVHGHADKCQLKSPRQKKFVDQDGISGTGEFTVILTSPDDLATASKGKLKYTVKCKKENATSSVLVKIPYNIYGVALAVSPKPIPNPSTNTTFTLEVLPEKGKAIESCEVALPMYDTTQSKWVVDTESVEAWKAASKVSGKKNTFRLRNTTLAGHLSPSDRMKMESNVCIEELPFRARCQHETAAGEAVTYVGGTGAETGEANEIDVNLWPKDSSVSLTPSTRRITGPNDPFGLIFEPEGDLHSCSFTVNGRATDYFDPVPVEGTLIWPKLTPESLDITEILAAQTSTSFTVKVTCETKVSYNNNGLGMCPQASALSDSVVIDYEPVNPTVTVSVTSHSEVTRPGGSITVRYERKATEQPPLSCLHSEFLDGTWTEASSVWPTGKSLVDNTVVTRTYTIPSSLDGVNELRFDALCTYANGDEASSRASVPVKIPLIVDVSTPKRLIACDPNDPTSVEFTYTRRSGTATACEYTDRSDTSWRSLNDLASNSTVRKTLTIPNCTRLGIPNAGDLVEYLPYHVRCYPIRDSKASDLLWLHVQNIGDSPPGPITFRNLSTRWHGNHYSLAFHVHREPRATTYEWTIGKPGQPNSYRVSDSFAHSANPPYAYIYRLQPSTRYELKVRGRNKYGHGPWSESHFAEMLSGITNPREGLLNGFTYRGYSEYGNSQLRNALTQKGEFIVRETSTGGRSVTYTIQWDPSTNLNQWGPTNLFFDQAVVNAADWLGELPTAPMLPQDGKGYFNTTSNKLFYGQGGTW